MRSLFGLGGSSNKRTVLGKKLSIDVKDVEYIRESNLRLNTLHELYNRYRGTPHAQKIKLVYEKTKRIHNYLTAKNMVHELELFHIQNTEHFINTFTVIIDVHQEYHGAARPVSRAELNNDPVLLNNIKPEKVKRREKSTGIPEMIRPLNSQRQVINTEASQVHVPSLSVPEITINTFAKIPYRKEEGADGALFSEIGFTSMPQEKEEFLRAVSAHLGMEGIAYVGNALVNIPNSNGTNPTGMVPIISWGGFLYAVNLNDYRLFPVKFYKKSS